MLTYSLWSKKYYTKDEYKQWQYLRNGRYSYSFRLFICILFTILCVPIDILFCIPELIIWLVYTLWNM